MRGLFTLAVLLGLLGATVAVALWAWQEIGDVSMSWHGIMAMLLGAIATFGLGAGLMALVFFSNRRGYDERAHQSDDTAKPPERSPPPE